MLVLNPDEVRFGERVWPGVTAIAVERSAARSVAEWADGGPHAVFVDVPEQAVRVKVVRRLERDDLDGAQPGEKGELVFLTSPGASEAGRKRVRVTAVVTEVRCEIGGARGAVMHVSLTAVAGEGEADPVRVEDASGGGA